MKVTRNGTTVILSFGNQDSAFEASFQLREKGFEVDDGHFIPLTLHNSAEDALETAEIWCQ